MSFYSKCYISDIHWVSTGENRNPKLNPISFGYPNPKIVGEKSEPNPKPADIRPELDPLPALLQCGGDDKFMPDGRDPP
jgi:hypothetical protein